MKQMIEQLKDSIPHKGFLYDRKANKRFKYDSIDKLIGHVYLMFMQYTQQSGRRINISEDLVVFKIGIVSIGYIIREK